MDLCCVFIWVIISIFYCLQDDNKKSLLAKINEKLVDFWKIIKILIFGAIWVYLEPKGYPYPLWRTKISTLSIVPSCTWMNKAIHQPFFFFIILGDIFQQQLVWIWFNFLNLNQEIYIKDYKEINVKYIYVLLQIWSFHFQDSGTCKSNQKTLWESQMICLTKVSA